MVSFKALLFIYVFGGLTFVPLLVIGLAALVWYTSPELVTAEERKASQDGHKAESELDEATIEAKKKHKTSTRVYRSGWVTVRRTFEPVADVGSDAGYMTMMASSYRSFVDSRSKDPRKSRPRDKYYAVLKDTVLFLYEDEQENDCFAAIKLPLHEVVIYPEGLIEGELFMKKNAICLKPATKAPEEANDEVPSLILRPPPVPVNGSSATPAVAPESAASLAQKPWFIFPSINHDKEDWYQSLLSAHKLPDPAQIAKDGSLFDPNDMGNLVDAIDDQPDPIPTRWLNAMVGRLFFSVYRTSAVEDYIVRKLMRKLSKVNKPDFLGDIEVKEVDVGNTTPFFSKPMLKELTAEGDASMEVHVKYAGEFRIAISTVANINLGQRFKSYSVKLVLAVILKDLEGNVLFKVKRPPSNRVWFGFTSPPKLGLRIEPVVSTRQIKWSLVTKPIESRLRELVAESIVLPHMDDIAFFDTKPYEHRGGIYGECLRKASSLRGEAVDGMEPAVDTEEGQLMPGVPNPKLGDPKEESGEQVRQRHARARKSSGTESILSTKSAPLGAAGAEKPSSFNLSSWGTSTSLETHSHEHRQHHHKHKDHDHSRKRSWFTSSSAVSKSKLGATESDSALPLPDTKDSEVAAVKPQNKSAGEESVRKSHSTTALPAAAAESSDAAVERLRGILEAGKSQSTPLSIATNATKSQQSKVFSAGLEPEAVLTASPEPSLYKTSSGSSVDTTHAAIASAARPSAAKTSEAETGEHSPSNLVRHESGRSTSSSKSAESSQDRPALQPDNASIASGHDGSSSASVFSNSSTSSNIAILQNWKTKATDKQAIQASVNQARDAMSKWGNKWQAYRKAHQTANQGDDEHRKLNDDIPQLQQENVGTSGSILHRDGKLTPETRSRSSSLISSSPTGHFQPSAATTTTSLSGVTGPSIDTALGSKAPSQRSPLVRRVPPPSTVPVHPAVGQQDSEQPAPPKRQSYTPAPMMSIPGIDASRRFHASSADASLAKGPPPLPSRDAVTAEQKPATSTRVPVPSIDTAAKASSESPRDISASPARSSPPPLPVRPAAVAASVTGGPPELEAEASAASSPDNVSSLQQSRVRSEAAAEPPTTSMRVPNNEASPAVIIQPPTPAPEAEATFDQQDILDNGSEPVADDPVRPNVVV